MYLFDGTLVLEELRFNIREQLFFKTHLLKNSESNDLCIVILVIFISNY